MIYVTSIAKILGRLLVTNTLVISDLILHYLRIKNANSYLLDNFLCLSLDCFRHNSLSSSCLFLPDKIQNLPKLSFPEIDNSLV